jgi:hypothetical protein
MIACGPLECLPGVYFAAIYRCDRCSDRKRRALYRTSDDRLTLDGDWGGVFPTYFDCLVVVCRKHRPQFSGIGDWYAIDFGDDIARIDAGRLSR